jgi:hypothetical protein
MDNFFPKFYFPLLKGLYPIYDNLSVCKGGYGGEGGYAPHAKGGSDRGMWITLLPHPSYVDMWISLFGIVTMTC